MAYSDPEQQRNYSRKHYLNNKEKYLASNSRRKQLLKQYVIQLKESTPCNDCNKLYPYYVMDFDHLSDKVGLIAKFVRDNNKTGLEKEITKCDIVCSNCHRIRSFTRAKITN